MKTPILPIVALLCITAMVIGAMITDAHLAEKKAEAPAKADPDGFALVKRIGDLERELGHREAECDALADQLDSAVAELHAAGALLKQHGIEYTPETLDAIER